MNDLKNGIIDINGFLVGPNTTTEDLEKHFGLTASRSLVQNIFDFDGHSFMSHDLEFKCRIFLEEHVSEIELVPQLPILEEKYGMYGRWWKLISHSPENTLEYFREVRNVLDDWLEKQLGTPTIKDADITSFRYSSQIIAVESYIQNNPHGFEVYGGKVVIWYD